jgi:hypothetical protein
MIRRSDDEGGNKGRRSILFILVLVFIVAFGGTVLALQFFGGSQDDSGLPRLITVEVKVTTTPLPPVVQVVTATLLPNQIAPPPEGVLPADEIGTEEVGDALAANVTRTPLPTIDPAQFDSNEALRLTATSLPTNCIPHTIAEGDTPFGVAEQYGANPFDLMTINGLDDESASLLQIGDVLIVPLEGCEVAPPPTGTPEAPPPTETPEETEEPEDTETPTPTPTLTATPSDTPTITPTPTITLAPTTTNAQMEIVEVIRPGDVTAEAVRILNTGSTVNVTGWTLSDLDGNVYTFEEQIMFSNSDLTINTRAGDKTTIVLFWGLDEAVWQPGDIVTLRDDEGRVQATLRLPEDDEDEGDEE